VWLLWIEQTGLTCFYVGDIYQMPIMPEVIKELVAKFGDLNDHVRKIASDSLLELAKHSTVVALDYFYITNCAFRLYLSNVHFLYSHQ